jgi:hypothetical protein
MSEAKAKSFATEQQRRLLNCCACTVIQVLEQSQLSHTVQITRRDKSSVEATLKEERRRRISALKSANPIREPTSGSAPSRKHTRAHKGVECHKATATSGPPDVPDNNSRQPYMLAQVVFLSRSCSNILLALPSACASIRPLFSSAALIPKANTCQRPISGDMRPSFYTAVALMTCALQANALPTNKRSSLESISPDPTEVSKLDERAIDWWPATACVSPVSNPCDKAPTSTESSIHRYHVFQLAWALPECKDGGTTTQKHSQ